MFIRPYRSEEARALAGIYRDAIAGLGADAYSPRQLATWAAFACQHEAFAAKLQQGLTLVSTHGGTIAGFAQLDPLDHIALLFTAAAFARRGHASRLCDALETHAFGRGVEVLRTEASHVAKPFFLGRGWRVVEPETVEVDGVEFECFKMRLKRAR